MVKATPEFPAYKSPSDLELMNDEQKAKRPIGNGEDPNLATSRAIDDTYDGYPLVMFRDAAKHTVVLWLVKHIAEQGSMGAIYGQSGSGKSFLAQDLSLALARYISWMGRRTHGGPILYIAAEAGQSVRRRVEAYQIANGLEDSDLQFAHIEIAPNLLSDADASKIIATTRQLSAVCETDTIMIVIDTLSRSMDGDDGSGTDMPKFVRACDRIRTETGAAICIVHHSGHSELQRARGHSSFRAALDWEIHVEGLTGPRKATITKVRDSISGERFAFNLKSIEIGTDDDGEPETSCVVEQTDAPEPKTGNQKRLSAQSTIALQMLYNAVSDAGETPPANRNIPTGVTGVPERLFRDYCDQGTITKSDKPHAKRVAFNRAVENLQAAKEIGVCNGWVWPAQGTASQHHTP